MPMPTAIKKRNKRRPREGARGGSSSPLVNRTRPNFRRPCRLPVVGVVGGRVLGRGSHYLPPLRFFRPTRHGYVYKFWRRWRVGRAARRDIDAGRQAGGQTRRLKPAATHMTG